MVQNEVVIIFIDLCKFDMMTAFLKNKIISHLDDIWRKYDEFCE